jgi:hypothetical protein
MLSSGKHRFALRGKIKGSVRRGNHCVTKLIRFENTNIKYLLKANKQYFYFILGENKLNKGRLRYNHNNKN